MILTFSVELRLLLQRLSNADIVIEKLRLVGLSLTSEQEIRLREVMERKVIV